MISIKVIDVNFFVFSLFCVLFCWGWEGCCLGFVLGGGIVWGLFWGVGWDCLGFVFGGWGLFWVCCGGGGVGLGGGVTGNDYES